MVASKITWGDAVIVKSNAPEKYNPLERGSVCGIRVIETSREIQEFCCSLGKSIYLVEFSNGCSVEIPGLFLSKYLS